MKRALITGITGQDGSYLAELLLEKGYRVYGMVRRTSGENFERIVPVLSRLELLEGDLSDPVSLNTIIEQIQPDELYNLAAQTSVPNSWKEPVVTTDATGVGLLRVLEAVRKHSPHTRLLQASSAAVFGDVSAGPKSENTPFHPRNPYGVAKAFAHKMAVNYRVDHGLFSCACICFNHESPRRGNQFLSRKVTEHVARIKFGLADKLRIGNLETRRDWGFAGDTVRAMWLMLQQQIPDDFVIATGETHSVRELVEIAFGCAGLDWERYVERDPEFVRPGEVDCHYGDASKAHRVLGWKPEVSFHELIEMMVEADLENCRKKQQLAIGT